MQGCTIAGSDSLTLPPTLNFTTYTTLHSCRFRQINPTGKLKLQSRVSWKDLKYMKANIEQFSFVCFLKSYWQLFSDMAWSQRYFLYDCWWRFFRKFQTDELQGVNLLVDPNTMTMQVVDIFLLSFHLLATYQPFASPLYSMYMGLRGMEI